MKNKEKNKKINKNRKKFNDETKNIEIKYLE